MPRKCPLCGIRYVGSDHLELHRRIFEIRDGKGWREFNLEERERILQEYEVIERAAGRYRDYRRASWRHVRSSL